MNYRRIELKGMTFDHDFSYSFHLFSYLRKKRGKKKRRMDSKNRDQKSCLSTHACLRSVYSPIQGFGSVTIYLADMDHLKADPLGKALKSTTHC